MLCIPKVEPVQFVSCDWICMATKMRTSLDCIMTRFVKDYFKSKHNGFVS